MRVGLDASKATIGPFQGKGASLKLPEVVLVFSLLLKYKAREVPSAPVVSVTYLWHDDRYR